MRLEGSGRRARILLVDDNRPLVENLTEILEEAGYLVHSAGSCAGALRLAADGFEGVQITGADGPPTGALLPHCGCARINVPDEADTVTGPAMVNLLRQLRGGFHERPARFPASIALIGMRDLRDYLAA